MKDRIELAVIGIISWMMRIVRIAMQSQSIPETIEAVVTSMRKQKKDAEDNARFWREFSVKFAQGMTDKNKEKP